MVELKDEAIDAMLKTNVKGLLYCTQAVAPYMMKQGSGKIVNISSIASLGISLRAGNHLYAATKGGITSMSKVAAVEHGPNNIRVNVIKPGQIATRLLMDQASNEPGILERIEQETPLGRLGKPEDVAQLALFLASDESSFITGEAIVIDGGIEAYSHIA